jgi:antitoxin CptB
MTAETPMNSSPTDIDERRRRLLWRASHRGTKELDLVLGGFVRDHVAGMTAAELGELEALVSLPDPELMAWIVGDKDVEDEFRNRTTDRFLAYRPVTR